MRRAALVVTVLALWLTACGGNGGTMGFIEPGPQPTITFGPSPQAEATSIYAPQTQTAEATRVAAVDVPPSTSDTPGAVIATPSSTPTSVPPTLEPTSTVAPGVTECPQIEVQSLEAATRRDFGWLAHEGARLVIQTELMTLEGQNIVHMHNYDTQQSAVFACRSTGFESPILEYLRSQVSAELHVSYATTRKLASRADLILSDGEHFRLKVGQPTMKNGQISFPYTINGEEKTVTIPESFNPSTPIEVNGSGTNSYRVLIIGREGDSVVLLILSEQPAAISGGHH